jgi:hypothetical protein
MKILIIGDAFFGYIDRIKIHLEKRNILSDVIYTFEPKWLDRAKKKLLNKEFDEKYYYQNKLKANEKYNLILVINGKKIPEFFIEELKESYKNVRKILYAWDDLLNLDQSDSFFEIFDRKYSYSKLDSTANPEFIYQPFFFTHQSDIARRNIGASFVGSLHSDRQKNLRDIRNLNPEVIFFIYLYSDIISFMKYIRNTKICEVKFKILNYDNYIKIVGKSSAIIELPHPKQKNITTRAIEVLGTKTKLITTVDAVKNYDFYNENNIFIINNNISQIQEWLKKDYVEYHPELTKKYHIDSWLDVILNKD